jgi:hypothetical protein
MRLTRRVPALVVAGLAFSLIAPPATIATAAPVAPSVSPKAGTWTTVRPLCPGPDGKVETVSTAVMHYPKAIIGVRVWVRGQVTDDGVLAPGLQFEIKVRALKYFKDIDKKEAVTAKTNGAPAFAYKISFTKSTTTLTRKEVAADVADAISRGRKQEVVARNLLLKSQSEFWGKPGKCVTATLDPNNISTAPKDSGTTTGTLTSVEGGGAIAGNWKLVKTYVGKLANTTQKKQLHPDFPWTAAAQADANNDLVKVTLRASSKQGLADVTFVDQKELGKVRVEVDVALVGNTPVVPGSPSEIGQLTFGATLSFDATEQKGMPGVYALDGNANWSFPVQSVTVGSGSDCLNATITSLTTSSPFSPSTSPDMPAGDTDVILLDPSNQWRFTPTFLYYVYTTETPPPFQPNNCSGNAYWWQVFNGMVAAPSPFTPNGNYLDTVVPNGDINTTQTVKWTRDLSGLSIPLLTGGISGTVNVTPLPNPAP